MKSLIRTMIVLAVFCLAVLIYTPAQGGVNAGASTEAGTQPVVATPYQSTEPLPPLPSISVESPAGDEFEVSEQVAVQPSYGFPSSHSALARALVVGGKSSNVLVIPNTDIKAEDVAAITQDMQVMSHIFDKIFQGPRLIEGVFMDYGEFLGRGSG